MRCVFHFAMVLLLGSAAWGQSAPDVSVGGALRSLASRAGVVFVGQVVRVEPKAGAVEVTFRVDQAVQGSVGASYTLREWAGLWVNGQPRYIPGQRAMVFLHAPGVAGLSTPVDGMEGVVPVVSTSADAATMLDARWLATRVQRNVGEPLGSAMISVEDAVLAVRRAKEPVPVTMPVRLRPVTPVRILPGVGDRSESSVEQGPAILLRVAGDVR